MSNWPIPICNKHNIPLVMGIATPWICLECEPSAGSMATTELQARIAGLKEAREIVVAERDASYRMGYVYEIIINVIDARIRELEGGEK